MKKNRWIHGNTNRIMTREQLKTMKAIIYTAAAIWGIIFIYLVYHIANK